MPFALACDEEEPDYGSLCFHDVMNDPLNCGACDNVCPIDNACEQGQCVADRNRALWPIPELPLTNDHYEVGDETVLDLVTGLEWQRHAGERVPWDETFEHCAELELDGGGWRLPTKIELVSIVDFTRRLPAINDEVFPVPDDAPPWGSKPEPGIDGGYVYCPSEVAMPFPNLVFKHRAFPPDYECESSQAASVAEKVSDCDSPGASIDFMEGTQRYYDYAAGEIHDCTPLDQFVRCVRGGPEPESAVPRYEIDDGTALDVYTGLRWQRFIPECHGGSLHPCERFDTLEQAQAYCEELVVDGYDDFRLPSIVELYSLIYPWEEELAQSPAGELAVQYMDGEAFPEELGDLAQEFYSSTPYARSEEIDGIRPWVMRFDGSREGTWEIGARRVRCVRIEQRGIGFRRGVGRAYGATGRALRRLREQRVGAFASSARSLRAPEKAP